MVCLRESLPAHLSPHPNLIITDIAYSPQRSLLQLCTCILLINFQVCTSIYHQIRITIYIVYVACHSRHLYMSICIMNKKNTFCGRCWLEMHPTLWSYLPYTCTLCYGLRGWCSLTLYIGFHAGMSLHMPPQMVWCAWGSLPSALTACVCWHLWRATTQRSLRSDVVLTGY